MSKDSNDPIRVEKIFGAHRIPYDPPMQGPSCDDFKTNELHEQTDTMYMLSRALNVGRVIAFVGSGVSANYGYPDWRKLAKDVIGEANKLWERKIGNDTETFMLRKAEPILKQAEDIPKLISNDSLTLWLGEAKRLMDRLDQTKLDENRSRGIKNTDHFIGRTFRELVEKSNWPKKPKDQRKLDYPEHDPLDVIINKLNITRFVTTNYDHSIYNALKKHAPDIAGEPIVPSESDIHKIIDFSTRTNRREGGVLHLHGMARQLPTKRKDGNDPITEGRDWEKKPLVVSDREYQRAYYSSEEDEPHRSYRLALAHMFRANAFLFVGTALSENEVIRPLRMLAAERENHPTPRELFAILRRPDSLVAQVDLRNFLYHTYGVRSIFFDVTVLKGEKLKDKISKPFVDKLKDLAIKKEEWWTKWRDTPIVRFPVYGAARDNLEKKNRLPHRDQKKSKIVKTLSHTSFHQYNYRPRQTTRHALVSPNTLWREYSIDLRHSGCSKRIISLLRPNPFWARQINKKNVENALDTKANRLIVISGSDGTGKRQVEELITKKAIKEGSELISGTTYFSFDFQSLLGYLYDQIVLRNRPQAENSKLFDPEDSVSRFEVTLSNLKENQTIVIDGIDQLLTNLREAEPQRMNKPSRSAQLLSASSTRDRVYIGEPSNSGIARFFELLLAYAKGSNTKGGRVVLLGSAMPSAYVENEKGEDIGGLQLVRLSRPSAQQVAQNATLIRVLSNARKIKKGGRKKTVYRKSAHRDCEDLFTRIATFLEGDIYPLSVLDRYFAAMLANACGDNDLIAWSEIAACRGVHSLKDLESYLSARSRNDRPARVIEWVLDQLQRGWTFEDAQGHKPLATEQPIHRRMNSLWEKGTSTKHGKKQHWPSVSKIDLQAILLRLSLFWSPATARTLVACFGAPKDETYVNFFDDILRELARLNLIFAVRPAPRRSWEPAPPQKPLERRYVVHRRTRRAMLRRLGEAPHPRRDVRRFLAATFSGEPEPRPTQTIRGFRLAAGAIDNLLSHLEDETNWRPQKKEIEKEQKKALKKSGAKSDEIKLYYTKVEECRAPSRNMLRAAYGLLRTSWDAISLPNIQREEAGALQLDNERTHLMDGYLARLSRMANLLSAGSQAAHRWKEFRKEEDIQFWRDGVTSAQWDLNGILYGHELTSLFNELGMASYVHGALNDAYPFFETALNLTNSLNRADATADIETRAKGAFSTRWAVVHANLAMVRMERGFLLDALDTFKMIDHVLQRIGPYSSRVRNLGWIARLYYFLGRKDEALDIYRAILGDDKVDPSSEDEGVAGKKPRRRKEDLNIKDPLLQPRARSIFLRHRAELHRSHAEYKLALRDMNDSLAIAASGDHHDQMHATAVGKIFTDFLVDPSKSSFKQIDPHIAFARRSGLLKMEANFYRAQARIAHYQGYPDVAWRLALQSTEITNYNGVQLDATASLIVLGQAAADLVDPEVSKNILEQALSLASRQQYVQQRTVAAEALRELETGARRPSLAFAQFPREVT